MATITISNHLPSGSELFVDSESFMSSLTNDELVNVTGGCPCLVIRDERTFPVAIGTAFCPDKSPLPTPQVVVKE